MAVLAQGFMKLLRGTGATPTYAVVKGVFGVDGGGFTPNKIDATDFDTPAGTREYISGPREPSPYTFSMHYEQGDVQQEAMFAAMASNTPEPYRITFGSGAQAKQISFNAVPNLTLSAPVDGKVTYSGTLEPMAAPVRDNQGA